MLPKNIPTSRRVLTRGIATLILAGSAATSFATFNFWDGDTSSDWNTPANWSLNRVPNNANGDLPPAETFDDAVINITGNGSTTFTPVIGAAGLSVTPRDILIGNTPGSNGRLDQTAGTAQTGNGNWFFVGTSGGTGQYNLANTATTGGTYTGFGLGSGSLMQLNRIYIGGRDNGGGGTGVVNMNTTGTLASSGDFAIGASQGNGTFNLDAGTVTAGGWFMVSTDHGGGNSTALMNQSGGSVTGNGRIAIGFTGVGTYNLTGGTATSNDEFWVGEGTTGNGTLNIGAGATATSNSWFAVGRNGSQGVVNNSGTFTKNSNNDNQVVIGTNNGAGNGTGTFNNNAGGTFTTGLSDIWVGENGSSTGTLNVNGGTVTTDEIQIGRFNNATGFLTVKPGGTLNARNLIIANGDAATGTVTQTGGNINITQGFDVKGGGASGTYILSGGKLSVDGTIDATAGTFTFNGTGKISRGSAGVIDYNGDLIVGASGAGFDLGNNKTFDVSGAFNVSFGLTLDLAGLSLPADNGTNPVRGSILLGHVGSILNGPNGFDPSSTTITGLGNPESATFITEAAGEGGLFNTFNNDVFWVQHDTGTGNVTLEYNVVPEPSTFGLLGLAGLALASRRRRKK